MKCSRCHALLDRKSKFCRLCGTPVSDAAEETTNGKSFCRSCGKKIAPDAKFCNYCGAAQTEKEVVIEDPVVAVHNHYAMWNILPGQLASKIDERTMTGYKGVRGLYIAPGTRALFFVNGHYVASLESGKYPFQKVLRGDVEEVPAMGFLKSVAYHIANGIDLLFTGSYLRTHNFYTVVLVKGADFALEYEIENVTTKGVRSTLALHMLCSITDLNAFFEAQMTDKKYVSINNFKEVLLPALTATLNALLREKEPQEICDNPTLISLLLPELERCLHSIYSYVSLKNIVRLTANQKDIEELRQERESLFVDNEKLDQLQLRNEYLNRAHGVDYAQKLAEARSEADYQKLADDIDIDRLMNETTRQSLVAQLEAEKKLKVCRSTSELEVALDKLERDNLLSREAVEALKRKIEYTADEEREQHAGLLAITVLRNHLATDRERLAWELDRDDQLSAGKVGIEKREFEWAQERNKQTEALRLEQDKARHEFDQTRRAADFDLQKQMDAHKMELLKQAQLLREQNLQAAHEREMAIRKQTADAELAKQKMELDVELEEQKLYFGMTAEQIMVANPRISPAAATAMSKRFEVEAAAERNAEYIKLLQKHNDDIKEMARDQQQLTREMMSAELRHSAAMTDAKQQELDRVHEDSQKHEDRLLSGVQTATSSMATAMAKNARVNQSVYCTNCGKKHMAGVKICDACNATLE